MGHRERRPRDMHDEDTGPSFEDVGRHRLRAVSYQGPSSGKARAARNEAPRRQLAGDASSGWVEADFTGFGALDGSFGCGALVWRFECECVSV